MKTQTIQCVPLFGAEDLRQIERVNTEIDRHTSAGKKNQPTLPLFDDSSPFSLS